MVSCQRDISGLSIVTEEAIIFLVKLGEEILCLSLFRLHIPQEEIFSKLCGVLATENTAQRGLMSKSKLLAEIIGERKRRGGTEGTGKF